MSFVLTLIRATAERKNLLAGLALVPRGTEPVHTVLGAVVCARGLQAGAIEVGTARSPGLQVLADAQELFGDSQIAVHWEDFATQGALEARVTFSRGNHDVIAGCWCSQWGVFGRSASFWATPGGIPKFLQVGLLQ